MLGEKRSISSIASTEKTKIVDSAGTVDARDINETTTTQKATSATDKLNNFNKTNGVNGYTVLGGHKNGVNVNGNYKSATCGTYGVDEKDTNNLSYIIRDFYDSETRNIENFIDKTVDKTVTGIVELKDDFMNYGNDEQKYTNADGMLRQRNVDKKVDNENFIKKEIEALNSAVQQNNVLPAVLSNGHAK